MALHIGRCTNFGNCAIADRKEIVQVPDGADLICPECRRPLTETTSAPVKRSPSFLLLALIGLIVLFGLGLLAFQFLKRPSATGVAEQAQTSAPVASSTAAGEPVLRLHGSNTIGSELVPALVTAFLKQDGASDVKTKPAGTDAVTVSGTYPGDSSPRVVEIDAHGSATAFTDMAKGSADIGMASRKINDAEAQSLSGLGDMTSPASEHVLGLDGVAVIVNRANTVDSLSKQQIAGLFSGDTASWSDVGGPSGQVKIYARDNRSGTFDTFKALVLGTKALSGTAQRFEDSRALSSAVAADVNGIGFVGLPYVGTAKAIAVSEKGARALLPNRFTISTEDYLLSRRLYLYTPRDAKPLARKFVDFALSKAGQDIVASTGFVEQTVRQQDSTALVVPGATSDYQRTTQGAQRLSLDFRFRTGSSQLDNKALADLDRVTSFLADLHYTGSNVMLLGFADSTGSAAQNLSLSKARAQAIAAQFGQRGVQPGMITGFGAEMPVASNDTDDGRQKNRRVEIWAKK